MFIELMETLAEAEDDMQNGRVASISDTFQDLRNMLQGEWNNKNPDKKKRHTIGWPFAWRLLYALL